MFSLKKSLATFVCSTLLAITVVALLQPTGAATADKGPRRFYLTKEEIYMGNQALTACDQGYHMASLWEIHDPSNLRYNITLGLTLEDSGFGPPASRSGWIRTGFAARTDPGVRANCGAWTSSDPLHLGTVVFISSSWEDFGFPISPWGPNTLNCSNQLRVWCVED